jgi:phosphatidylglycerophosphatase A
MRADGLKILVVTSGGLGYAPFASGTFGTLGGVVLAVVAQILCPSPSLASVWLGLAVLLFFVGVALGPFAIKRFGRKDPSEFVLDEVAGYLVTVGVMTVFGQAPQLHGHLWAFFVFRAADVLKPMPARQLERLPAGFGIMADDLMAGVYAGLLLALLRWLGLVGL